MLKNDAPVARVIALSVGKQSLKVRQNPGMIYQLSEEWFIKIEHIMVGVVVWRLQYNCAIAIAWESGYETLQLRLRKDIAHEDASLRVKYEPLLFIHRKLSSLNDLALHLSRDAGLRTVKRLREERIHEAEHGRV